MRPYRAMNLPNRRNSLIILFVLLLFTFSVWGMYTFFTSKVPGANDFFPRWKGAQLFWQDGIDPYSQTATEAIQRVLYGGKLARPDQDQVLFVYPFYTVFLLRPLVNLDYAWVQAIWLVFVQFSLIGGVIATLRLLEWRQPPWLLAITLLWSVIMYNSTRTIILGQFAGPIFLWLAGTLLALKHEQDVLAGMLLSLTTIKPQMSYLIIPALLLWALWHQRWHFVAGFVGAMALLAGLSFLLLPSWLSSFIEQVLYYPDYTVTPSPLRVITGTFFPQLGQPVEYVLIGLLQLVMLWQWWQLRHEATTTPKFLFIIGLTLIVTNSIIVRTATTNYVIMYIPLFLLLHTVSQRWRGGNVWVAGLLLAPLVGTWALFLSTIQGDFEHPVTYLPLPIGLLLGLIWLAWGDKLRILNGES
ncbi:glycosyltransferase family 87 protein [Candidatus Leptofilum sp.]|uniref:glycosyltransferase family 87 protein n=1 Tax=Candidatus Leptofilum sp. TaxID=3241576 RepID=UPI003B5914FA